MRCSTSRRSTSSCFSPGPRRPMPPCFCRDRWVHIRFSRGMEYSSWASSTASRASCVWARLAKMSRISSVRSSTLTPVAFSRLRVWPGLRSLSKMITSASVGGGQGVQLLDLALAQIGGGVGGFAALGELPDHPGAGRLGQSLQFLQRDRPSRPVRQQNADQNRRLADDALGAIISFTVVSPPSAIAGRTVQFWRIGE